MGAKSSLHVDNAAHLLYFRNQVFPCDRDVEAALPWQEYALTLSSDTDCLKLWDEQGLVRLARVGVYPQDMALREDTALVCGGADGKLHQLSLPDLIETAAYQLPGMPERICTVDDAAFILTLLTEPEVHTALLMLSLAGGQWTELQRLAGIPEAIAADKSGLWIAVSDGVTRLRWEELRT